jgi:glycosyltransferase involved in cell wall biosynthesis
MLTRIVPEKRVKLVIEAVNELGLPLKIAGTPTGSSQEYATECRKLAGDSVEFLGWVDGADKQELLAKSEALIFAAEREDFGMPPVEAMASGKPVVGVNEGYTQHQIIEGKNGYLFTPTHESLTTTLRKMDNQQWDSSEIQQQARQYDVRTVRRQWIQMIRQVTDQC